MRPLPPPAAHPTVLAPSPSLSLPFARPSPLTQRRGVTSTSPPRFEAYTLVRTLGEIAASPGAQCNIVCTIHQPSSDIFALFDDLTLLLGGRVVYAASARGAVPHFATAGFTCPQYANPADYFFMHVLTSEGEDTDASRADKLVEVCRGGNAHASARQRGVPRRERACDRAAERCVAEGARV